MKIEFIKSPVGFGLAYHKGETLDCPQAYGMEMIEMGFAVMIDNEPEALPSDIPGRTVLVAAGLVKLDDVKAIPDLTQIEGIDAKLAARIVKYLSK